MRSTIRRTLVSAVAVVAVAAPAAQADVIDRPAWSQYTRVVHEHLAGAATTAPADNITCDPQPVVDGRMVTPRTPVVLGEVYAQVELAAHFKCVTFDWGMYWSIEARVTDMYWRDGTYHRAEAMWDLCWSFAGACTVNPIGLARYPGGHGALNTWHYAHFEAWTSTGRHISWVSPLFYVAGI